MSDFDVRCKDHEVVDMFNTLSNWKRWGADDELGTLNLITPEKTAAAARLVQLGTTLSLSHDLATRPAPNNPRPVVHIMQYMGPNPSGASDFLGIACHGFATTHVDALGHEFHDGHFYNGFAVAEHMPMTGLRKCSVNVMRNGVATRGVFLDVAKALGRTWLDVGEYVHVEDLEKAEAMGRVRVEPGDVMIVRVGQYPRMEVEGIEAPFARNFVRNGLDADCLPWIRERGVSIFGGDCIERMPSGYPSVRMPLHQIGVVMMGLILLDHIAVEELSMRCEELGRWEFMFTFAPTRLRGGTGAAVNPIAIF
jgi:kynurenine formamidase